MNENNFMVQRNGNLHRCIYETKILEISIFKLKMERNQENYEQRKPDITKTSRVTC